MRGYEVVDEVLDGPQSIAFRQSFHKMTSAMAVLAWCVEAQPQRQERHEESLLDAVHT
jgi:ornithine carbamoyltransferase